jgi:hypothetical protein
LSKKKSTVGISSFDLVLVHSLASVLLSASIPFFTFVACGGEENDAQQSSNEQRRP